MFNEISILISIAALLFAMWQGITLLRRNQNIDNRNVTSELTTVIVKLENIGVGISEIKNEMTNLKKDIKEDRERIVKLETYCEMRSNNKK